MATTGVKRKCLIVRRSPVVETMVGSLTHVGGISNLEFVYMDESILGGPEGPVLRVIESVTPDVILDYYVAGCSHTYTDTDKLDLVENSRIVTMIGRGASLSRSHYIYCTNTHPTMIQDNRLRSEDSYSREDVDDFVDQGLLYAEECVRSCYANAWIFRMARVFGPGDHDLHDLIMRELGYASLGESITLGLNNCTRMNWLSVHYASFLLSAMISTILDGGVGRCKDRTLHLGCRRTFSEYEIAKSALSLAPQETRVVSDLIKITPLNKHGHEEAISLQRYYSHMDLTRLSSLIDLIPIPSMEAIEESVLVDGYLDPSMYRACVDQVTHALGSTHKRLA